MTTKKNPDNHYVFLYWNPNVDILRSDLIDADSAIKLWNENIDDFMARTEKGETPRMAIWAGCNYKTDFTDFVCVMDSNYPVIPKCSWIVDAGLFKISDRKIYSLLGMYELFEKILELEKEDKVSALTYMFNELEDRMLKGNYIFAEEFMNRIWIEQFSISLLMGILTITLPFESKLYYRRFFLERVKKYVYKIHSKEEADAIWSGVE